jgi:glycosyltransferase involved in cell wall biosynthesis
MLKKTLRYSYKTAELLISCLVLLLSPIRYARRLTGQGRIRSIWAGTAIITLSNKAKAEKLLGVDSKSLVYDTYYITDDFDYNLQRYRQIPFFGRLVPLIVFGWACLFVDRLHFYCDRGLLPSFDTFTFNPLELFIYKLMRIQVFLWAYGADVRSRTVTLNSGNPNCCTDCDDIGRYCVCDESKQSRNVKRLAKLSNAIFSGVGDMFDYTPGSINDTYYWPLDLSANNGRTYRPIYPKADYSKPLRVVHSTNHRIFKGTKYLVQGIDELQAEGLNVELVLVEKVPNAQALEIYRSADIIFDNCIMGNYGFLAIEAMALGKPVLCFIRHPEKYLLNPWECPIVNIHFDSLKNDIRGFAENRDRLEAIGRKGREYVERYFSLEAFAQRLGKVYDKLGVKLIAKT